MKFELELSDGLSPGFSMYSHATAYPLTSPLTMGHESFDSFCWQSTTEELGSDFDRPCTPLDYLENPKLAPVTPNRCRSRSLIGPLNIFPDQISFPITCPTTPKTGVGNLVSIISPLSSTSSSSTESLASWDYENHDYASIFQTNHVDQLDVSTPGFEAGFQLPLQWHIHGPPSPSCLTARSKSTKGIRKRPAKSPQPEDFTSDSASAYEYISIPLDLAQKPMFKCGYLDCDKSFRRSEHLKRHKQTFHGEGPNRFTCEFCGRDQFNRRDNLNNHRKLHARPSHGNRTVKFIPAAIPILEKEERYRKRRAVPMGKGTRRLV